MITIPAWVREILRCPQCKGPLVDTAAGVAELICEACRLAYPVTDGIPVLLAADARPLEPPR